MKNSILRMSSFYLHSISVKLFCLLLITALFSEKSWGNMGSDVQMKDSFFSYSTKNIQAKDQPMSEFKGKVVLVVNVASKCGYTPQYKGLETLYEQYKTKGFVILGFPSNDFGQQEPGSDQEIKKFCDLNYGVTFPLMTKGSVKGAETQPIYQFLVNSYKGEPKGDVAWNFEKFLINKKGQVVGRFKSGVKPDAAELKLAIESALKE